MDKNQKLALIQRTLALKHKLRVHDTLPDPENHDELSKSLLSRWELEDELHAIEDLLKDLREKNVQAKKESIKKSGLPKKKPKDFTLAPSRESSQNPKPGLEC